MGTWVFLLRSQVFRMCESPHLSLQLSIWVLVVPKINLCMKYAILCVDPPPGPRFLMRLLLIASLWGNVKKRDFCTLSFVTQQISLVSQIGERDGILRTKLHISYTDQFLVPPILKYLERKMKNSKLGLELANLAYGNRVWVIWVD